MLLKKGKYIGFCVHRRSYLLWSPVIVSIYTQKAGHICSMIGASRLASPRPTPLPVQRRAPPYGRRVARSWRMGSRCAKSMALRIGGIIFKERVGFSFCADTIEYSPLINVFSPVTHDMSTS